MFRFGFSLLELFLLHVIRTDDEWRQQEVVILLLFPCLLSHMHDAKEKCQIIPAYYGI